uniref:Uncharacterized protein n=1 Tax=Leersia perrieri TaxID=77586 RepID=A0A0D9V4G2_9ORYZ
MSLRSSKFPNYIGTDPVNLFPKKSILARLDKLPMDLGMVPVIWLFAMLIYPRFLICPNSGGIAPSSLFSLRSKPRSPIFQFFRNPPKEFVTIKIKSLQCREVAKDGGDFTELVWERTHQAGIAEDKAGEEGEVAKLWADGSLEWHVFEFKSRNPLPAAVA